VAVSVAVVAVIAIAVATRPSPPKQTVTAPATTAAPTTQAPTTVNPLARIAPLTGVVDPTGGVAKRCAVTVKIGNTSEAHPQSGVGSADIVYEVVVDGGITRLAAVYQSHTPDKVGPLRSVRPSDQQILRPLGGVFAYSGGNAMEVASLNGVPVIAKDETAAGPMMFRDPARVAPHNLYAHVNQLFGACASPPPQPLFGYRIGNEPAGGKPASAVTIGFKDPYSVTWNWDAKLGKWKRRLFGAPDLGASGGQLNTSNVVVMSVGYQGGPGGIDTEVQLVGSGPLSVYTDGRVITGSWSRADQSQPIKLRDAANKPIRLTPGPTWVELPDLSYPVTSKP
jgi:hypothetical protein